MPRLKARGLLLLAGAALLVPAVRRRWGCSWIGRFALKKVLVLVLERRKAALE